MAATTPTPSVAGLLDQLDQLQLREDVDWRSLISSTLNLESDSLLRQYVKAGWLTPFQANLLILGRGQELRLGGYVLLDRIGEGGMGAVFTARHLLMRRIVALKLIRSELLEYPHARRRFLREVELLARLSHPHIVTAHDAEEAGNRLFLVMEYCEGTSLANLVHENGPLSVGMACACAQQAALGLQHAMEHGLVHRDIKPGNLLVTAGGLKVLDLGLARLRPTSEGGSALTDVGTFLGTPDFVAPEQARNSLSADIRSDLYSLGCTVYFALTGTVPFPGGTAVEKVLRHQSEQPIPLTQRRPDTPAEVAAIISRLMAKSPADRYQTPQEIADALKSWSVWDENSPRPLLARTVPGNLLTVADAPITRVLPASPSTVARSDPPGSVAPRSRQWRRSWILVASLAVGIVTLLILLKMIVPPEDHARTPPGNILVDSPDKWQMIRELVQPAFVYQVAFSPDGKTLAVTYWPVGGTNERQIILWDVVEGKEIRRLEQEAPAVGAIAFSPDGRLFASGAGDLNRDLRGKVIVWDASKWEPRYDFIGGSRGIMSLTFSPDSKSLAIGDRTGSVTLWHVTSDKPSKPSKELRGHEDAVNAIVFLPDGRTLATASGDRTVRLWDLASRKGDSLPPGRLPGHAFGLTLSPDQRTLACATQAPLDAPLEKGEKAGAIFLWDVENRQLKRAPLLDDFRLIALKFSPDGKYLVVGKMNACSVLDPKTGEFVRQLEKAQNSVVGLSLPPNGSLLAVGIQGEQLVKLWKLR
jgi:serine/threonine-protein kinase